MKPTQYRIRREGFERIDITQQGFDIYARKNWRVLYDPIEDKEITRYMTERKYLTKRGLSQVVFNGRRK